MTVIRLLGLTLGETLVEESDLSGDEVEVESAEQTVERRRGDEAVRRTRLDMNGTIFKE